MLAHLAPSAAGKLHGLDPGLAAGRKESPAGPPLSACVTGAVACCHPKSALGSASLPLASGTCQVSPTCLPAVGTRSEEQQGRALCTHWCLPPLCTLGPRPTMLLVVPGPFRDPGRLDFRKGWPRPAPGLCMHMYTHSGWLRNSRHPIKTGTHGLAHADHVFLSNPPT